MTCYIIDDEQHAIDTLSAYINRTPGFELFGSNTVPAEALQQIKSNNVIDILFLDVDMPVISGLEIVELLPPRISVVFTTGHSSYALNAFEHNAVDFLLKPISYAKFLKTTEKLEKLNQTQKTKKNEDNEQTSMFINPGVRGKVLQIHFTDVLYIEGLKNYIMIYTTNGRYVTYLTMSEILTALPVKNFIRVHKSFIINLNKIQSIEGNSINLVEHIQLPLGVSHKDKLMQVIANLTIKSSRNS
jgi:two-component system LytT family response regulator